MANLALVCAGFAGTETNSTCGFRDPEEIEALVDGVITAQLKSPHIPGAVVAVVAGGKLCRAKDYGYAELKTNGD